MKTLTINTETKEQIVKEETIVDELPSIEQPPSELEILKKQQADLVLELLSKGVL